MMADVLGAEPNGLTVVSTFAGLGGSSLGYRLAGYRVLWANEFLEAPRAMYEANKAPHTLVDERDIRKVQASEILKATGLKKGELDLFDGSPPCTSFSIAGKREKNWGEEQHYSDKFQRTDDLSLEYLRLAEGLMPRVCMLENVRGMALGKARGFMFEVLDGLRKIGYRAGVRLLDGQWLGVPQARERVFFVGVREDLKLEPVWPEPLPYRYTVRDAIPWLERPQDGPDPEPDSFMGDSLLARRWHGMRVGSKHKARFTAIRTEPDKPCKTILAIAGNKGMSSVMHPFECRKFSVLETKRLSSVPDDFEMTGRFIKKIEALGRCVPPLMTKAVAATIAQEVLLI